MKYFNFISVVTLWFNLAFLMGMDVEEAITTIKSHVQSYINPNTIGRDLCEKYTCCTLSATESCDVSSLTKDASTLILPGGTSQCIFSSSTPYAFQVFPGASDKVLFYFQGGGACWDEASTNAGFCTSDVSPSSFVGIFDRSNANNKYSDYTIIQALYCSGDVWGGNITQTYTNTQGSPVTQVGLVNTQATLDWVVAQQEASLLADTLSELVVMGCSAGSLGAQIWGPKILSSLKWEKAAVILDSYAGVFPEGTQGPLVKSFGFCTWTDLPRTLLDQCLAAKLTFQDINAYNIKSYSNVPFAFIQSKVDGTQQSFYVAIGASMNATAVITPTQFYNDVNDIFGTYNQENSNFLTYLVDGSQHRFTDQSVYYTADGLGPTDNNSADNSGDIMTTWVSHYPLEEGASVDSLCLGTLKSANTDRLKDPIDDNTYCSSDIVPKEYTRKVTRE